MTLNLDNQVKLLDMIQQFSTSIEEDKLYSIESAKYGIHIIKNSYSKFTFFRLNDKSIDGSSRTMMKIYYHHQQNKLDFKSIYGTLLSLQNITSIIQDYKQMDINQFILAYSRDLFNINDYPLEVVLNLLENYNELR